MPKFFLVEFSIRRPKQVLLLAGLLTLQFDRAHSNDSINRLNSTTLARGGCT